MRCTQWRAPKATYQVAAAAAAPHFRLVFLRRRETAREKSMNNNREVEN